MKAAAHQFASMLKRIEPANTDVRLARSLAVVHTFAMGLPVNTYANADQAAEALAPKLRDLINEINEFVQIDARLCQSLLLPTLKLRYELLNGTCDPAVINMVLRSSTAQDLKAPNDLAMTNYLTSRPDYAKEQQALSELLGDVLAQES